MGAAVRVSRHVFVHTLDADLKARAAVGEHVAEVGFEAVVGARFDCDADAL